MPEWDELPPPNLEVADRGTVTVGSGSSVTVEAVANENEQVLVAFGHSDQSTDASAVDYHIDDDATNGTLDLVFDEATGGGDAEIDFTVIRIVP